MTGSDRHKYILLFFTLIFSCFIISCSDDNDKVVSEGKLEDVLFDYHLADAMVSSANIAQEEHKKYFDAVLDKHGITQAEFDSSMVYYMRHADKLHKIYEHLSDRMSNEARLQGLEGNSLVAGNVMEGDTANIWNMEKARVFTDNENENLLKFYFATDTTYRKGDRFIFSFKTDFLYQDGARNGYAVISIKFKNDSVATRSTYLSSSSQYTLELSDDNLLGVKEIRGFIMQRKSNSKTDRNNQTLRMMVVSDIKLIKMHTATAKGAEAKADSLKSTNENNEIYDDNENKSNVFLRSGSDSMRGGKPSMHKFYSRK